MNTNENDDSNSYPVDLKDLRTLAVQVFTQAFADYIHLQSPLTRKKPYVHEAWLSSIDMFHDPDYRLAMFPASDGNEDGASLQDFLYLVSDRDNVDLEKLYQRLAVESKFFWDNKMLEHYEIPQTFMICNHPYTIISKNIDGYQIDYDSATIYFRLSETLTDVEFVIFYQALIEILCFHLELRISKDQRMILGKALFEVLRLNYSFLKV